MGGGGREKEKERNRERKKEEQRGDRKSSFTGTSLRLGIVSFSFLLALTFGYCSGLRKMGVS